MLCTGEMEFVVMFSCRLRKVNPYGIKQERNFVLTNLNVYNFKQKSKQEAAAFQLVRSVAKRDLLNKEDDFAFLFDTRLTLFG